MSVFGVINGLWDLVLDPCFGCVVSGHLRGFFTLNGLPNVDRLLLYLIVKYLRSHSLGVSFFLLPFNSTAWQT